jgi:catechol 2,3-dioxygenase-like lactoylglutathione lyase family enzyme
MNTMTLSATDHDSDEVNNNPDAKLRVQGLNHTTVPVRDRYKAARFYVAVLGAEMHHESAPDRVKQGLARSLQVGVRLCSGLEIDLFEQSYGQPGWDQSHPHHAFDVTAEAMGKWAEHMKKWGVPFVGPMTRPGTVGAEIYFNDPDGNHLELHCSEYPGHEKLKSGPYDKMLTIHQQAWPSAELESEADRLLDASVARMRARRKRG